LTSRPYYWLVSLVVVLVDQMTKLLIHFRVGMGPEGQVALVGDWLKIHYTTNPGMAFGLKSGLGDEVLFSIRFLFVLVLGFFTFLLTLNQVRPSACL